MKLKKNDVVLIISGKDRGKKGKIIEVFPKKGKILVEGINLIKKSVRPKKSGEKGQIISMPSPIDASKTKIICSRCGKAVRIGYRKIIKSESHQDQKKNKKIRICKKCGEIL